MSNAKQILNDLDCALSRLPNSQCAQLLRKITDFFLVDVGTYTEEQLSIFDDVFVRLFKNVERSSLINLIPKLAKAAQKPANAVLFLASHDDILVSGPALEFIDGISDSSLTQIAGRKSQQHLLAIAGRARMGDTITDILIEHGGFEVFYKIVTNRDAAISEIGFVKLISRSKSDKILANAISNRDDLPSELAPFLKLALGER